MTQSICILYGLNEGPAMGRRFAMACERAGLKTTRNPAGANIIFAHSGGCFLVPAQYRAELVILSGLPYWPGRPTVVCLILKIWREWRLYHREHRYRQWIHKWANHLRSAFNLKADWRMAVHRGIGHPWNSSGRQVILRNRNDTCCTPAILGLPFKGDRAFISLPGEHDDCWDNPDPYVSLIQSLTGN